MKSTSLHPVAVTSHYNSHHYNSYNYDSHPAWKRQKGKTRPVLSDCVVRLCCQTVLSDCVDGLERMERRER